SLPEDLLEQLSGSTNVMPEAMSSWLERRIGKRLDWRATEWSEDELYLALPRPGGDGWLSIDRVTGDVLYEVTDRGWIAYFNDLHKGRHTGVLWSWFIDLFAATCVVFSLTGFWLLARQAARQAWTWPLTLAGVLLPLLL